MLQTKNTINYTVHFDDADVSDQQFNLIITKASWELSKLNGIIDITWNFLTDNFIVSLYDYDYNFIEGLSIPVDDVTLYPVDDEIPF